MSLGAGRHDPEILNSIFRAAHSIKGGSGTFGFTQLSEATHEMETLFDALRKGRGRPTMRTVRLLLDACDVFKAPSRAPEGGRPRRRSGDGSDARRGWSGSASGRRRRRGGAEPRALRLRTIIARRAGDPDAGARALERRSRPSATSWRRRTREPCAWRRPTRSTSCARRSSSRSARRLQPRGGATGRQGERYGLFADAAATRRRGEVRAVHRRPAAPATVRARPLRAIVRRRGRRPARRTPRGARRAVLHPRERREDRPHREPRGRAGDRAGDDAAVGRPRAPRSRTSTSPTASRRSTATRASCSRR